MTSPYVTGGGGVHFDSRVGAYFLASLLTRGAVIGLDSARAFAVELQRADFGQPLDDVIVIGEQTSGTATLSLQIKTSFTFSLAKTNQDCVDVVSRAWSTFRASGFNRVRDRVGIAIGSQNTSIDTDYQRVIDFACATSSAADFLAHFQNRTASQASRNFKDTIFSLVKRVDPSATVSDLHAFISCFRIIYFDFLKGAASVHQAQATDQLGYALFDQSRKFDLWNAVCQYADRVQPAAGSLNFSSVMSHFSQSFNLRPTSPQKKTVDLGSLGSPLGYDLWQLRPEIDQIMNWFNQPSPRAWALCGLAGQGKTEIARQLGTVASARFTAVVAGSFEDGRTSDRIISGFHSAIFGRCGKGTAEEIDDIVNEAKKEPMLFIVDGLEAEQDVLSLPHGAINSGPIKLLLERLLAPGSMACVLITTRVELRNFGVGSCFASSTVGPLNDSESIKLLSALGVNASEAELLKVVKALHGHPLSLMAAPRILSELGIDDVIALGSIANHDERVHQTIVRYRRSLTPAALSFIRVASCSDRPVPDQVIRMLLGRNCVPGLSARNYGDAINECRDMVQQSRNGRWIVHPAVRSTFQQEWLQQAPQTARAAHALLAENFELLARRMGNVEGKNIEDFDYAVAAIHHWVMRGNIERALICRKDFIDAGSRYFTRTLGAWSASRAIELKFFQDGDVNRPRPGLENGVARMLRANIGFASFQLGRMEDAIDLSIGAREEALQEIRGEVDFGRAAISYMTALSTCDNVVRFKIMAGDIPGAAEQCTVYERVVRGFEKIVGELSRRSVSRGEIQREHLGVRTALYLRSVANVHFVRGEIEHAWQVINNAKNTLIQTTTDAEIDFMTSDGGVLYVDIMSSAKPGSEELGLAINRKNYRFCSSRAKYQSDLMALKLQEARLLLVIGRVEEAADILGMVGNERVESVDIRVKIYYEKARQAIARKIYSEAHLFVEQGLSMANTYGFNLLRCDGLLLMAELEAEMGKPLNHLMMAEEAVTLFGYGLRQKDIERLRRA